MGVPDGQAQGELVSTLMGTIHLPLEAKQELAAFLRALQTPQQHRDTPLPERDPATAVAEL